MESTREGLEMVQRGGFIQGEGSTGQDVGDSRERSDWTVGAEGKGVRPGRFSFKGQSLPSLEKIS